MELEKWMTDLLTQYLKFPVPDTLVNYILSIETDEDVEEYLNDLLDINTAEHRDFITTFLEKRKVQTVVDDNCASNFKLVDAAASGKTEDGAGNDEAAAKPIQKKDGVLLKGRKRCDCEATKHNLINKCKHCGRIVCEQERSGPCTVCGNLVVTDEEQAVLDKYTQESAVLFRRLMEQKRPEGWEPSSAQINRFLRYDQIKDQRTSGVDDGENYFDSGSIWFSKTEQAKLVKYEKSMREKKLTSKDANVGGESVEEKNQANASGGVEKDIAQSNLFDDGGNVASGIKWGEAAMSMDPGYTGTLFKNDNALENLMKRPDHSNTHFVPSLLHNDFEHFRIQDTQLRMTSDEGVCLSMHQPWASLLVAGIKIHEGRTWSTPHRGRLYIASTLQEANALTIKTFEDKYKAIYPGKKLAFPKVYLAGCLLGCVTLEDVLSQEEYRNQYPDGQCDSPFVFICSNHIKFDLKLSVTEKEKIFKLESDVHQAAKRAAMKFV